MKSKESVAFAGLRQVLGTWCLVFAVLCFSAVGGAETDPFQALRALPIQDSGRIKPYDTFCREVLAIVHGKETYESRPAVEVVTTWLLHPQAWEGREFIEIRYHLLKRALHFDETQKYFSLRQIYGSDRLSLVMQELQSKRESKEKLDPYYQSLQRLESQVSLFRGIASGEALRFAPGLDTAWLSLNQLSSGASEQFATITKIFIQGLEMQTPAALASAERESRLISLQSQMTTAVESFQTLARGARPDLYPDSKTIQAELFYNSMHPFQKAWIFDFLAVVALFLLWVVKAKSWYQVAWACALVGLCWHILGFGLRVYLTGRPPVSNMYETVVWVSFGVMIFAMVLEAVYRWRFALLAGAFTAGACLLLADNAPVVLDPSLQPLQAVLNSNFWLTTHVLTITISYAAFFLAFALGDVGLYFYIRGVPESAPTLRAITLSIYRAMQIGVGLLAPGIILGGIWADYSWGRFWGWDPKETWALIALLGYVAVLHSRLAGLLKNFGLVCSAVVTFSLVIMAWYGVNFVLGAGLHSYGFGAGGVEYVATFVVLHLAAVIFVAVLHRSRQASAKV